MKKQSINLVKKIFIITIFFLLIFSNLAKAALLVPGTNRNHWVGTLRELFNASTVLQGNVNKLNDENYEEYKFVVDYLKEQGLIDDSYTKEEIMDYMEKNAASIQVDYSGGKWSVTYDIITRLPDEDDEPSTGGGSGDINPNDFKPTEDVYSERLTSMAQKIIGIIQIIGTVASIIIILIIGIRYITGSVEERAEYKTTAFLYIIGAVFLFCTVTIIRLVYNISTKTFN